MAVWWGQRSDWQEVPALQEDMTCWPQAAIVSRRLLKEHSGLFVRHLHQTEDKLHGAASQSLRLTSCRQRVAAFQTFSRLRNILTLQITNRRQEVTAASLVHCYLCEDVGDVLYLGIRSITEADQFQIFNQHAVNGSIDEIPTSS